MEKTNLPQEVSSSVGKLFEGLADNFSPLLERLAGTQSDLTLKFDDLTLDTGTVKAKIKGTLTFDVTYSNRQQTQTEPAQLPQEDGSKIVSRTVYKNVEE